MKLLISFSLFAIFISDVFVETQNPSTSDLSNVLNALLGNINQRLDKMETEISKLKQKDCITCENITKELQENISAVETTEANILKNLDYLSNRLEEVMIRNELYKGLEQRITNIEGNETATTGNINTLEVNLNNLKQSMQQTLQRISRIEGIQASKPNPVAFMAVLSHNIGGIGTGRTIVFDQISLNSGNGYNKNTGVFTAPYSGIYVFSVTIVSDSSDNHVIIKHNGRNEAYLNSEKISGHHGHGSTSITLHLIAGDRVWVEVIDYNGHTSDILSDGNYPYTYFTGHLVNI